MEYKNYNPRAAALAQARTLLTDAVKAAIADGTLPEAALPDFIVEIPADVKNGDIASNAAMAGARAFHKAPRQIAEAITAKLRWTAACSTGSRSPVPASSICSSRRTGSPALCAPPWPIPSTAAPMWAQAKSTTSSSSPPTPPARCTWATPAAALGDGLAACLDWAGYDVTREFYINDAGNQIEKFGKSLAIRYLQLYKGEDACPLPEECYQGADIIARARSLPKCTAIPMWKRTLTS